MAKFQNQSHSPQPVNVSSIHSAPNHPNIKLTDLYSLSCAAILLLILLSQLMNPHHFLSLPNPQLLPQNPSNLTIPSKNGQPLVLPYLRPTIITPPNVTEPPLTKLNITDIAGMRKLLENRTKVEVAALLWRNWQWNRRDFFQLEYYNLNGSYDLDGEVQERRICVMAPFRNLLEDGIENASYLLFLKSINQQNYSNYHVYMIDDASTDTSTTSILASLPSYPRLNNRVTLIQNPQKIGALANRDSATRNYCRPGDIVMDVDGDDNLIGKQVFNLFNRLYWNQRNAWFVYNNFVEVKVQGKGKVTKGVDLKQVKPGPCRKIFPHIHQKNTYRTTTYLWMTSQTRTYLRDLYVKIPLQYVIERGTGKYFTQASDRFTMYALAELAGPNHTFYFQQYNYFYYSPSYTVMNQSQCSLQQRFFCQAQSRILTPLLPLKSLTDDVERTKDYVVPEDILGSYVKYWYQYAICREGLDGVKGRFGRMGEV